MKLHFRIINYNLKNLEKLGYLISEVNKDSNTTKKKIVYSTTLEGRMCLANMRNNLFPLLKKLLYNPKI